MTLNEWIVNGRVGISSKTIWGILQGIEVRDNDIPYDPSDFSRCWKLVTRCNISVDELKKVYVKLPYWKPYIDNWNKLTEMYEKNRAEKWVNSKEIGMYDFMDDLRKESHLIRKK